MLFMAYDVTLIPGDGVGPEVSSACRRCVDATGADIRWDVQEAGSAVFEAEGDPLPQRVLDSIMRSKVALKGPVTTPLGKGFRSVNVRLRQTLDLFASVRPCKTMAGLKNAVDGVDIVVVRENTEDLYAGIEYERGGEATTRLIDFIRDTTGKDVRADSGISVKPISEYASRRIAEYAFDYAKRNGRRKVTSATKSNIMKFSDGIFMKAAGDVAASHPDTAYEHVLVDALCMKLVQDPRRFDVLVLPNLYGDIVSDLCAGLTGGLGTAPGANIGPDYAVFEAVHGSAPDIAGRGVANPTALVLSGAMLLEHLGEREAGDRLRTAVEKVVSEGRKVTPDLNPKSKTSTDGMADAIIERLG
jgi:isocitrate dehydrogenase (NAD+)